MGRKAKEKPYLEACSIVLLYFFANLIFFIFLSRKTSFAVFAVLTLGAIVLPVMFLFLELSGLREGIWKQWKKKPKFMHWGICIFCGIWIIRIFTTGAIIKALKNSYEKD